MGMVKDLLKPKAVGKAKICALIGAVRRWNRVPGGPGAIRCSGNSRRIRGVAGLAGVRGREVLKYEYCDHGQVREEQGDEDEDPYQAFALGTHGGSVGRGGESFKWLGFAGEEQVPIRVGGGWRRRGWGRRV